jgi:hydroxymethylbilane synthase
MPVKLRIGSRPSALALAQAALIKARLEQSPLGLEPEVVQIRTSGDRMISASLAQVGGKGLFIKELEQALGARRIDIAVHSMKDLPASLAPGYRLAAVPEREDSRDAIISRNGGGFEALAHGARLGTSSARRRFEALRLRPDLAVEPLRGNVDTRLKRLTNGDFDAVMLALAGLRRLNRTGGIHLAMLEKRDFIPAGGQGALAIEALAGETVGGSSELEAAVTALNDSRAFAEITAERSFLATIGASCVSPVGVSATLEAGTLGVRAILFSLDGSRSLADEITERLGSGASSAASVGAKLGERMLARGAAAFIA